MRERNQKVLILSALIIGVFCLSIAFASGYSYLSISTSADVKPKEFKVEFIASLDDETSLSVSPKSGNGEEATIDNTEDPKITGIHAHFDAPGETVIYEVYAKNKGGYNAYLNSIDFSNIDITGTNSYCESNGSPSEVSDACNAIKVSVKVGDEDPAYGDSTYSNHILEKNTSEKIIITIEYNQTDSFPTKDINIQFGDITLVYGVSDVNSSTNILGPTHTPTNTYTSSFTIGDRLNVTIWDNDNDGTISFGDKVKLADTEYFYVFKTDEATNKVTMLSEWNLNVGTNNMTGEGVTQGIQNTNCRGWIGESNNSSEWKCITPFSNTAYWQSEAGTYPRYVFNGNSILWTPLKNYETYLKDANYSSVEASLPTYEDWTDGNIFKCTISGETWGGWCSKNGQPSWLYQTRYWLGSAYDGTNPWFVAGEGVFGQCYPYSNVYQGLRAVITIKASEI